MEILKDTLQDGMRLLPFLFVTYLVLECIEHKANERTKKWMSRAGRFGPIVGGLLGAVPQCGFAVVIANFYAAQVVTFGTVLAVFLATSDEMLPVLLASQAPPGAIGRLLGIKVLIAIVTGLLVDFVLLRRKQTEQKMDIEGFCRQESCQCCHGIFSSALRHTIRTLSFLLIVTFFLNAAVDLPGEEQIAKLALNHSGISILSMGLFGLLPSCAVSVMIVQLFLKEAISLGAMLAGLFTNGGLGLLVLFRMNHRRRENLLLVGLMLVIAVVSGVLVDALGVRLF